MGTEGTVFQCIPDDRTVIAGMRPGTRPPTGMR